MRTVIEEVQTGYVATPICNLWPEVAAIDGIDDHQREHLARATVSRFGILGGSPGTGKTFTVARLISALIDSERVGSHEIAVAAPTGKAAVRLNELFAHPDVNLPVKACTIHSLLGVEQHSETGAWGFVHNESCPLPCKVLIVDESSMVDLALMRSLMAARPRGCHVLLVGDVNQLPPVGVGAPLRDLIAAGVPYGELTEIKRNSGGIVEACAAIRDCQGWLHFAGPTTNLRIIDERTNEAKIERLSQIAAEIAGRPDVSIYDLQILVAVNERSELGRKALNSRLQELLNLNPKEPGTQFRVGDKVVCLKNGYYDVATTLEVSDDVRTNDNGQVYVANGDLGQVLEFDGRRMIVEVTSPKRVVYVPLGKQKDDDGEDGESKTEESGSGSKWDLGYALSVHKAQGSEAKFVIIVLDDYAGARMICDRAWLYTAISRAKSICYLIGEPELAVRFCRVQKIGKRKTFLRERILQLQAEREVCDL